MVIMKEGGLVATEELYNECALFIGIPPFKNDV